MGGADVKRKNSLRRKKGKWARRAATPYRLGARSETPNPVDVSFVTYSTYAHDKEQAVSRGWRAEVRKGNA
jgi:hypothetical protein